MILLNTPVGQGSVLTFRVRLSMRKRFKTPAFWVSASTSPEIQPFSNRS